MKKRIGILMGGVSDEREISFMTSKSMIDNLDQEKFEVIPIEINTKEDVFNKCQDIDFALLGLHGAFGEDGSVQAILESMNIPYSGCGVLPSALCMDKDISKKILKLAGVRVADWLCVSDVNELTPTVLGSLSYPVFVKPNAGGSSVATTKVLEESQLHDAVKLALAHDEEVMIETFIGGDEITVPVIDGEIYPTLIIKPKGEFFDLASKYTKGGAEDYVIELPSELKSEVETMVEVTWKELKLESYARIDFLIEDGVPYLLEVNTLPGMTPTSLLPKSYQSTGRTFTDLLTEIIEISMRIKR